MPRAKKEDANSEPKKRSRTGCWSCKGRKVKCGEERPVCANCQKTGDSCDYSIRLNWAGRSKRDKNGVDQGFTFVATPTSISTARASGHEHIFSSQHIATTTAQPVSPSDKCSRAAKRQQPSPQISIPASGAPYFVEPGRPREWSSQGTTKRMRMSPPSVAYQSEQYTSPNPTFLTPPNMDSVISTPATSSYSTMSASSFPFGLSSIIPNQDPPDLRRLSVKSLLSDPAGGFERPRYPRISSGGYRTYGYDHGLPDYDVPRNDDAAAIRHSSPNLRRLSAAVSEISATSNDIDQRDIAFEPGGYYANPVAIRISTTLDALPDELQNNSMNLLYFHHFINHTARILTPHDCPENPLRGVLPQMAIRNKELLHLMLTFSASHRARVLGHPEPANRIAGWLDDVLPALRKALNDTNPQPVTPDDIASLAPLATAIMLARLETISQNTFAVSIPWEDHMDVARELLVSKGGLSQVASGANGARDTAVFFISRWFAYLDVLGSLSGGRRHRQPLEGAYLEDGSGLWLVNRNDAEIYQIDCFFGFSGRCIALLASVASLAAQCDGQRIDPILCRQRPEWQPSHDVKKRAMELQKRLLASAEMDLSGCTHAVLEETPGRTSTMTDKERDEMLATNEAFHWAGMLHLSRRILGLPRNHPEVQDSVHKIVEVLQRVRSGSTAEPCLLFPMFTAGCESIDPGQQALFLARMRGVEGWGMQHVVGAKDLMEKVWKTGTPWEILVDGEFIG